MEKVLKRATKLHEYGKMKTKRLYEYGEVKWYQQANPYILTGYLRDQTTCECLFNFSRQSNQLVNIWTHVIATIYVIIEMADDILYEVPLRGGDDLDRVAFAAFYLFFVICMMSSVAHHSFNSHQREKVAVKCFTADWSSCCLIGCFCYALNAFCLFRRQPFWLVLYMSGYAVGGFYLTRFNMTSSSTEDVTLRLKLTFLLVILSTLPLVHCLCLADTELSQLITNSYANNLWWQVFSLVVYVAHFPERIWPVRFDFCGNSHNLWHVLCVVSLLQWKYSALEFLSYNNKFYGV